MTTENTIFEKLDFKRILPVLVIVLVDLMGLSIIIPLLPLYAVRFGSSPLVIGILQATYPMMQFLGSPILGRLSDRFGRQTIEAGIKVTKQVFYLNRLKVRSEPAIYLQEAMTIFAANFIRWATAWIEQYALPNENSLPLSKMGIKKQIQVAAHTSATVIHHSGGMLLTFNPASAFAGKSLFFPAPSRSLWRINFLPPFTFLSLIAQKLR